MYVSEVRYVIIRIALNLPQSSSTKLIQEYNHWHTGVVKSYV